MTQAKTERSKYIFKVKEGVDVVFIVAEPLFGDMPILNHAFLSLDLYEGTTLHQAEIIANYLNEHIGGLAVTLFDKHPLFNSRKMNPR